MNMKYEVFMNDIVILLRKTSDKKSNEILFISVMPECHLPFKEEHNKSSIHVWQLAPEIRFQWISVWTAGSNYDSSQFHSKQVSNEHRMC